MNKLKQLLMRPVIIGLGKTGISVANYLTRKNIAFSIIDNRKNPPGIKEFTTRFPTTDIHLGDFASSILDHASALIISPGISLEEPAIAAYSQKGIPIIGDIELFAHEAKAPIIAITGTNAKGTVTTLVGEMIKKSGLTVSVGGNIGTPALDLLALPQPDFFVLEISSFQLEATYSLKTCAASILNLSPDHLDRHKTMNAYREIKQRIYNNCENAVFNRNDDNTYPKQIMNKNSFGLNIPEDKQFGLINNQLAFGKKILLSTEDLRIKGKHNWANALAALALGHAIGLPFEKMIIALKQFPGLPHRCEWIAESNNVHWYNDSKGTNIGATIAALEGLGSTLKGKIILIAGGIGKDQDFRLLQSSIAKYTKHVILIGRDAPIFAKALANHTHLKFAESLEDAVTKAKALAHSHDAVLLSPACASYDMFHNFEDRGEKFKTIVYATIN